MGHYVHWLVSWNNGTPDELKPLAEAALATMPQPSPGHYPDDYDGDAEWFLQQVRDGRGHFCGPKGDLWAIGQIGNYSNGDSIAKAILPFVKAMWERGYLFDFERVIIFDEQEQSERPIIYQIEHPGIITRYESEGWYWGQM